MGITSIVAKIVENGSKNFSEEQLRYINGLYKEIDPDSEGLTDSNRSSTAMLAADIVISPKIKTIALIAIGAALDIFVFKQIRITAILAVEYILSSLIKRLIGGIHLERILCIVLGFAMYLGGYVFAIFSGFGFWQRLILFAICYVLMAVYAPRDIQNGIQNTESKHIRRRKTLMLITISFIISNILPVSEIYANIVVWIIAFQTATILPIIFNTLEKE